MSDYESPRFGLPSHNPFDWRVGPLKSKQELERERQRISRLAREAGIDRRKVHESPEAALIAKRERNRQFMAMKRSAERVNPEARVDSTWVPKSLRAPR